MNIFRVTEGIRRTVSMCGFLLSLLIPFRYVLMYGIGVPRQYAKNLFGGRKLH